MRQDNRCGSKKILLTEESAKEVAKIMHKKHKAKFSHYQCEYCNGWHVGMERSQQAARRRHKKRARS